MTPYWDLTDNEWRCVAPLLPEMRSRISLRGRPVTNTRAVLNGVLWVIYSGATWSAMPRRYPSYQTCHRRFKIWHEAGVLKRVLSALHGEKGEHLYDMLVMRMRNHVHSKAAATRSTTTVPAYLAAQYLPYVPDGLTHAA
jgi:transposase